MSLEDFDAIEAAERYLVAAQIPTEDPAIVALRLLDQSIEQERACLAGMLPALIEAAQYVRRYASPDDCQRICHQLAQAAIRLSDHFEELCRLRPDK